MIKTSLKFIVLFKIMFLISPQLTNIIRLGKKNYRYINSATDPKGNIFIETSADNATNERIFYDIEGYKNDKDPFYYLSKNNTDIIIGKYEGTSCFIRPNKDTNYYLLSLSTSGYAETTDFINRKIYHKNLTDLFGYKNITTFGNIIELPLFIQNDYYYYYIFSFVRNKGINSYFVITKYYFESEFFYENEAEGFMISNTRSEECSKSKIISCFKTDTEEIMCLYRDTEHRLIIRVYDCDLYDSNSTILDYTGSKIEDDDIFFKGIYYEDKIGIFLYYRNYTGTNPLFAMKIYTEVKVPLRRTEETEQESDSDIKFSLTNPTTIPSTIPIEITESVETRLVYSMVDYKNFGAVEIDGTDFNRYYSLNDIIKTKKGDIYYVSASQDREKIYFVLFSINNNTKLEIKYYSIKMFESYNIKFYKDIKLSLDSSQELFLLFSHCNKKKCENESLHYTSIAMFQESHTNYNLIENLYTSNNYIEDGIMLDLNPYTKNIFGKKVEGLYFDYISDNITLIDPITNKKIILNEYYETTTLYLELSSFNQTGIFPIIFYLYVSDINDDSEYMYNSKTINRLRHLEMQYINYNIKIDSQLTTDCEDKLCSLCIISDKSKCLNCKYGYSFIGGDKYCKNEDGKITMATIEDVYESLKEAMENERNQIIQKENAIFQLSTIEEQKNSDIPFISSVDLGECQELLKEQEGLDDDEDLFMIKMDLKNEDLTATYVQYEIYNPDTLEIVNLDICENVTISLEIPVCLSDGTQSLYSSLEKYGYQLFNINDSFYNDICAVYTADNGADMTLSNRKEKIYDNSKNVSLCQKDCTFVSYDSETKKAKCDCVVQKEESITDITKISFDKTEFVDSFYNVLKNSNFLVMKCIKLVFSLKGQKNNIGSYMMSAIFALFIILTIVYILNGQKKIGEMIKNIYEYKKSKENDKPKEKNKIEEKEKKEEKEKDKIRSDKNRKSSKKKSNKKNSSKKKSTKKEKNNDETINAPVKKSVKRKSIKKETIKSLIDNPSKNMLNNNGEKTSHEQSKNILNRNKTKRETKKNNKNIILVNDRQNKNIEKNNKNTDKPNEKEEEKEINVFTQQKLKKDNKNFIYKENDLNDEEMNNLEYEQALLIDKRSYFEFYYSLLKKKHLILFIFLPSNDYNLTPIKFILFLISFSMYLTINGFFFSDSTMNKIYDDNGSYNFIYQLPKILYSTVVSAVINMILKRLSLSEKQIISLKQEEDLKKFKEKSKSIETCLKIRFIIFLILSSILMLFFWYFISCFCAVYENTQKILIKDTLVSFALSMVYLFGLNLLPGLFRIPALRDEKADKKCLYKISTYVALI